MVGSLNGLGLIQKLIRLLPERNVKNRENLSLGSWHSARESGRISQIHRVRTALLLQPTTGLHKRCLIN